MIKRKQLLRLGFTSAAISHRIAKGRLHPVYPGVYAVGRRELSREGDWMAAVLACGESALLSGRSAGELLGIVRPPRGLRASRPFVASIPAGRCSRLPGLIVHRRSPAMLDGSSSTLAIPRTGLLRTMADLATGLADPAIERIVNEADRLELIDPASLRTALCSMAGQPGVRSLRRVLDRRTFVLTDSELEQRFLPLTARAGLLPPLSWRYVNGYRVDFFWPGLGLVVETDGLRYHRTPAQQARDRRRDQAHAAAGLTPLRFTHSQVAFEPSYVAEVLATVAARLAGSG